MSISINESISTIKRCKGNWLSVEHYIISNVPMKENEKHGYCGICWENDFKDNITSTNSEPMRKSKPFKDSKINPKSGSCSNDCL